MDSVLKFFSSPLFSIIGGISTLIVVVTTLYGIGLGIKGIFSVLIRLGRGLSKRKIAVFAAEGYEELENMLLSSKLFRKKNIIKVTKQRMSTANAASIYLVQWKYFSDKIDDILARKKDSDALIVYAPKNEGSLEPSSMELINSHRNTILVNMRGRLMNDILTSMMTTGYEK